MSKALRMARVSAKGGINLFWGLAISTVISAIGIIVVARLLTPAGYGIVTVALAAPNLIQIFRDWGMDTATTRYTARYNSQDKTVKVKSTWAAGLLFEILLGVSLSIFCFLLSGILATDVFNRPDIKPLIQIASFGILAGALYTATLAAFTGIERTTLNSLTMILQSLLTTFLMTTLIILGLGTYGAVLGSTIAALAAGIVSLLILMKLYRNLQNPQGEGLKIMENMRIMFKYGLPLSLSSIITGFLSQFYTFLIAIYTTNLLIGNFAVAINFTVLITFFSTPISTMLFPAFSKLDSQNENETLRDVFKFSVKYGAFLVVPVATAIITLSQPAVSTLFGKEYSYAPLFLSLITITYLYSAFGNLSVGNLINSQGNTRVSLLLNLLYAAIALPMSLTLIPRFGIIGLIVTTLTSGIPGLILAIRWVKTHFGATVDWISSAKILSASAAAGVLTYMILALISFNSYVELIIGAAIFLVTFIIACVLMRIVNQSDARNLREMLKDLGPLSRFVDLLLNIIQKLSNALLR